MSAHPKFPLPQPIPTTPIRGSGIVAVRFHSPELNRLARRLRMKLNSRWAIIKPKRSSRGLLWRDQVFWWSLKGYYRNGQAGQDRRPFQHVLWEHYHGKPVPPGHEIFFRDRDRHNFTRGNLELLTKAECHERICALGECTQLTQGERQGVANKRWERAGARGTRALLDRFNHGAFIPFVPSRETVQRPRS